MEGQRSAPHSSWVGTPLVYVSPISKCAQQSVCAVDVQGVFKINVLSGSLDQLSVCCQRRKKQESLKKISKESLFSGTLQKVGIFHMLTFGGRVLQAAAWF